MRALSLAFVIGLIPTMAAAVPQTFSFNAGPVFNAAVFDPFAPPIVQNFTPFEDIIIDVTIDDATPSAPIAPPGKVLYIDPTGIITATGASSGTVVTFAPGVLLEFENLNEFDVSSVIPAVGFPPPPFICCDEHLPVPVPTVVSGDFYLGDDTDYRTAVDFLSDPTNLGQAIADIQAHFPGGIGQSLNLSDTSSAAAVYADDFDNPAQHGTVVPSGLAGLFEGFEFGPVASIPVPPTLVFMASVLAMAAWRARRRTV